MSDPHLSKRGRCVCPGSGFGRASAVLFFSLRCIDHTLVQANSEFNSDRKGRGARRGGLFDPIKYNSMARSFFCCCWSFEYPLTAHTRTCCCLGGAVDGFLTLLLSKDRCFREARGKVVGERRGDRKKEVARNAKILEEGGFRVSEGQARLG